MKKTDGNVREWTEENKKKYREMLATPVKRLTEQEQFELGAVSPHPPLGACHEKTLFDQQQIDQLNDIINKISNQIKKNEKI